jgi:hypothetical protein
VGGVCANAFLIIADVGTILSHILLLFLIKMFCFCAKRSTYSGLKFYFLELIVAVLRIPDSGSKRVQNQNPRNCFWIFGNIIRDVLPGSRIQGSKRHRISGSGSATLDRKIAEPANKANVTHFNFVCEPDKIVQYIYAHRI